jgi:ribosomal protein L31
MWHNNVTTITTTTITTTKYHHTRLVVPPFNGTALEVWQQCHPASTEAALA